MKLQTERAAIAGLILIGSVLLLLAATLDAQSHDEWISRGGHRNVAGEWCCGVGDCFVVPGNLVSRVANPNGFIIAPASGLSEQEFVPESDAQPSPDGAFWRCKRPDGTRRCFFAPPPAT